MSELGKKTFRELWRWRKYQKKVLKDTNRLIAVVKARQIGLTELASVIAVIEACSRSRNDVWIVGTNLETAKELLWRAKAWYETLKVLKPNLPNIVTDNTEKIVFSNRSRITALPCSAKAVRGKTGTIIMDEAAHIPNDEEIWTAFAPVISSNKNLKLYMFSTPFGQSGVFYRACHQKLDGENLKWSVHKIDVHQAIADGHSPDVLDLKSSFSEEGWAQEFLCSFTSQQGKYFPADLIRQCYDYSFEIPEGEEIYVEKRILGIDLASRKDMSICVECEWDGESFYSIKSPTILSTHNKPLTYPEQFEIIKQMVQENNYDKVIVDATGAGAGLAQFLKAEFGAKIIEHDSTAQWKAKYYPALKVDMQAGNVKLENNTILTNAFNSVIEQKTAANNLVYKLQRDENGHADAFSAAILAYSAVKTFPAELPAPVKIIRRQKRNQHVR